MNSHFSVHTADQQPRHYVPAAFQTLQLSRPNPKRQSLGLDPPAGTANVWGVVSCEMELVVDHHDWLVPEMMKNAGNPEASLGLAVDLVYMQDG